MGWTRLIFIEGLPGSGKTSLAQWLSEELGAMGTDAQWIPEIQDEHPAIGRELFRTASRPGYADRCVARWSHFAQRILESESPRVTIVEGCLLQSTVRFLLEYDRDRAEVDGYLPRTEAALQGLRPGLIYFTQTDVRAYLQQQARIRKGADIIARITRYTEGRPFATARQLTGVDAFVELYAAYRQTCDELVARSSMPVLTLDTVAVDEATVRQRAFDWSVDLLGRGGSDGDG